MAPTPTSPCISDACNENQADATDSAPPSASTSASPVPQSGLPNIFISSLVVGLLVAFFLLSGLIWIFRGKAKQCRRERKNRREEEWKRALEKASALSAGVEVSLPRYSWNDNSQGLSATTAEFRRPNTATVAEAVKSETTYHGASSKDVGQKDALELMPMQSPAQRRIIPLNFAAEVEMKKDVKGCSSQALAQQGTHAFGMVSTYVKTTRVEPYPAYQSTSGFYQSLPESLQRGRKDRLRSSLDEINIPFSNIDEEFRRSMSVSSSSEDSNWSVHDGNTPRRGRLGLESWRRVHREEAEI